MWMEGHLHVIHNLAEEGSHLRFKDAEVRPRVSFPSALALKDRLGQGAVCGSALSVPGIPWLSKSRLFLWNLL